MCDEGFRFSEFRVWTIYRALFIRYRLFLHVVYLDSPSFLHAALAECVVKCLGIRFQGFKLNIGLFLHHFPLFLHAALAECVVKCLGIRFQGFKLNTGLFLHHFPLFLHAALAECVVKCLGIRIQGFRYRALSASFPPLPSCGSHRMCRHGF